MTHRRRLIKFHCIESFEHCFGFFVIGENAASNEQFDQPPQRYR